MRGKILIALLLAALPAMAANHYIRSGASGAGTGNNWTDALTAFPSASSYVRGDTYYFADGTYTSPSLSTATSGTTLITVKKATVADHGTATGWSDSYASGSADLSGTLSYNSQYWIFSGSARTTLTNGYGVNLTGPSPGGAGIWFETGCSNNVLEYVKATGHISTAPESGGASGDNAVWFNESSSPAGTAQSVTIRKCAFFKWNCCMVKALGGTSKCLTNEYNWYEQNHSSAAQHAEGVFLWGQISNVWRYSTFVDIEGTGVIMLGNGSGNQIYGNEVWWTANYPNTGQGVDGGYLGNGVFSDWSAYASTGNSIHHNTIIVPNVAAAFGIRFNNSNSSATSYNNMFVCPSANQNVYSSFTTHDYNYFRGLTHDAETHGETGGSDLFVDLAGRNLRLTGHTTAGITLGSPYDFDMDGNPRLAPDKGAFEYTAGGDTTAPVVTAFTMPGTATSTIVTISSFTATDAVGVTGYLVNESASTPSLGDAGWVGSAPSTATTSTGGSHTFYAWAKDAAGNISSSANQTTVITLPVVTTFTITGSATLTGNFK